MDGHKNERAPDINQSQLLTLSMLFSGELKIFWEKEKILGTIIFSFLHIVFKPYFVIIILATLVICKHFQFGHV